MYITTVTLLQGLGFGPTTPSRIPKCSVIGSSPETLINSTQIVKAASNEAM